MQNGSPFSTPAPAGMYVHVPFCLRKCSYCDFYSISDSALRGAFPDAVIAEMGLYSPSALVFDTLYLGGGTPSLLEAAAVGRIIDAARRQFKISADAEITIEANPGTLTAEKLDSFRSAGINRINIGVQSFDPGNLEFLGRVHSVEDAELAMKRARASGFENLGLDLIYGLPGQTRKAWLDDLGRALAYAPEHISCYMLTCEPGTPLDEDLKKGRYRPLADGNVGGLFRAAKRFLEGRGYSHYEISNFARVCDRGQGVRDPEKYRSRHNQKYWSFASYLGFGPSAHSYEAPERRWNLPDVVQYAGRLMAGRQPPIKKEILDRSQLMIEAVYLGLRQARGICVEDFAKKFGVDFDGMFGRTLRHFEAGGLLKKADGRYFLTVDGMLYLDSIAARLIDHI